MRKIYLYEQFVNENRITWGAEEVHKLGNMPKKEFAAQIEVFTYHLQTMSNQVNSQLNEFKNKN